MPLNFNRLISLGALVALKPAGVVGYVAWNLLMIATMILIYRHAKNATP